MKLILLTILLVLCLLAQQPGVKGNVPNKYLNANSSLTEDDLARDINDDCASFISSDRISPNVTDVEFQLRTNSSSESFPLTELENIVTSSHFDKDKKLVLYISGWLIGLPRSGQKIVEEAYHRRNDSNFVATDSTHFLKTIYQWSIYNMQEIGETIAIGLAKLVDEHNYPLEKIHLIGHSLGVHIAGNAGRYFKNLTGKSIPRITGLDPANACFTDDGTVGLQLDNADFIDIIHTNPGVMGGVDSLGNVDFYVGGMNSSQPGCRMFGCSHIRACHYFAETVHPDNANNFLSVPCPSLNELNANSCKGVAIPMGYRVPHTSSGIYYLEVNSKQPYGKNDTYQEDDGSSGHKLSHNISLLSIVVTFCLFLAGTFEQLLTLH